MKKILSFLLVLAVFSGLSLAGDGTFHPVNYYATQYSASYAGCPYSNSYYENYQTPCPYPYYYGQGPVSYTYPYYYGQGPVSYNYPYYNQQLGTSAYYSTGYSSSPVYASPHYPVWMGAPNYWYDEPDMESAYLGYYGSQGVETNLPVYSMGQYPGLYSNSYAYSPQYSYTGYYGANSYGSGYMQPSSYNYYYPSSGSTYGTGSYGSGSYGSSYVQPSNTNYYYPSGSSSYGGQNYYPAPTPYYPTPTPYYIAPTPTPYPQTYYNPNSFYVQPSDQAYAGGSASGQVSTGGGASTGSGGSSTGSGSVTLSVSAHEYGFTPNQLSVTSGEMVTIVFTNTGTIGHSFTIPDLGVDTGVVSPGSSKTVTFTAPSTSGSHQFLCTVPGHSMLGMTGTLMVN